MMVSVATATVTNTAFTETVIATITPPTLSIGSTMIAPIDNMTLVYVPAGEFVMGRDTSQFADERPAHNVSLEGFWIDQTEVTNAMYAQCVNAGQCNLPRETDNFSNTGYSNHPVAYVSWDDASYYCSWALRRLPTEAEWEKAARGTDAILYPWGNEAPSSALLNYNQEIRETTEVRKYPEGISPYGAYDMAGNVWEWVSSLYLSYPYDSNDGRENLDSLDARVHRGGSFYDDNSFLYSARRDKGSPDFVSFNLGFRCALSAE
jgi:formylglycine-generating enzyme required for sulfatase activity